MIFTASLMFPFLLLSQKTAVANGDNFKESEAKRVRLDNMATAVTEKEKITLGLKLQFLASGLSQSLEN